ncbi:MAG TPA: M23 family metallopeptidase [Cellulomonas sp.]|uniref:M23 family metallopeptidase n=1 Tax=Cellulomonas sp. TaxID=40001 RepID=UPI002E32228A|nr:M23 family metallopeptidase [Cellulomonas sp.]HEX5332651.1 M23 family metallopeptidase [Cellulomonas sp.]
MTSTLAVAGAAAALALAASALPCGLPVPAGSAAGVDRAIVAVAPGATGVARASPVAPTYAPPLDGPVTVVRAFEAPPAPWAAGHRGVDLAAPDGTPVLAPSDGVVTFAGPVAGRPVVVVSHPDGLRSSLEPVVGSVRVGDPVTRGQVVGMLADVSAHCAPRRCVHWGVRAGETYLDPMSLLPIHGPVVLLPLD